MHELTETYEIDGRFHVIKSVGFNLDNMTAKEIADNSFADFKTEKEANSWAEKRSRGYKPKGEKMSAPSGRVYSEYDKEYQARESQVRKRVARNRNRRRWLREGRAKKGDRKDIHHKDGNTGNNSGNNLRSMDQSRNRAKK